MTWLHVRRDTKEKSPILISLLVSNRPDVYLQTKDIKQICVDIPVELWQVFVHLFWKAEVEEYIEAAHWEVVDEAEEVDGWFHSDLLSFEAG